MFKIVLVDSKGNADSYAAGDPTPGRGANEFETEDAAREAIAALDAPDEGSHWEVRPQ